jgi:hypothetical protein
VNSRCTAQFCMVCAAPWKTCNCPWFNYQLDENDRLHDMRVPYATRQEVIEVVEIPSEPAPLPTRRVSTRTRHRDRDVERADEALAAHLQAQLRMNPTPSSSTIRRSDPGVAVYGLGNSGGHHMNDSYTVRPLAQPAPRTAVRQSAVPRFFSRRLSVRESPRVPHPPATVAASTMAGLSRDGRKVGQNRVGTWLNHVAFDHDAVQTAPRGVEVDDWRIDGSMVGID